MIEPARLVLLPLERVDHPVEVDQRGVGIAEVEGEHRLDAPHVDAGNVALGKAEARRGGCRIRLRQVALEQRVDLRASWFRRSPALAIERLEFRVHRHAAKMSRRMCSMRWPCGGERGAVLRRAPGRGRGLDDLPLCRGSRCRRLARPARRQSARRRPAPCQAVAYAIMRMPAAAAAAARRQAGQRQSSPVVRGIGRRKVSSMHQQCRRCRRMPQSNAAPQRAQARRRSGIG